MSPIQIQTHLSISPEVAWKLYTEPEHITQWNFASPDWHCPWAKNNLEIGGTYQAFMQAKDQSFEFVFEATYTDIEPGQHFVYVMPDQRNIRVDFKPIDSGTQVTVTFDPENENPIDLQRQGWQAILDQYSQYANLQGSMD